MWRVNFLIIEKRLNKIEAQRLMINFFACTFKLWCNSLHPTRKKLEVQGLFASTHSLFCKYLKITLFVLKSDRSFDLCNQKVHYIEMQMKLRDELTFPFFHLHSIFYTNLLSLCNLSKRIQNKQKKLNFLYITAIMQF